MPADFQRPTLHTSATEVPRVTNDTIGVGESNPLLCSLNSQTTTKIDQKYGRFRP